MYHRYQNNTELWNNLLISSVFRREGNLLPSVLMTKAICVETGPWLLRNSLALVHLFPTLLEAITFCLPEVSSFIIRVMAYHTMLKDVIIWNTFQTFLSSEERARVMVKWLTEKYNRRTLQQSLWPLFKCGLKKNYQVFKNFISFFLFVFQSTKAIHARCNKANNSELHEVPSPSSLLRPWDNSSYTPEILCPWDNTF